jgi:hypothetical protein
VSAHVVIQVIKAKDATATEKMYGFNPDRGYAYFLDNFYAGNGPSKNGTLNPTQDGGYAVTGSGTNTVYTPNAGVSAKDDD